MDSVPCLICTKAKWSQTVLLLEGSLLLSHPYARATIVSHLKELAAVANKHIYILRAEATTSKTQLRSGACSFQKGILDAVTEAVNTLHL